MTKVKIARSSKTGQIVTMAYAKKHPSTTEVETVKKPAHNNKKK